MCKAMIYFLLYLQAQIIDSASFLRIRDTLSIGEQKGKAMTLRFNNQKIKQYLKYQEINLRKEQMMIKVKENCDRWREQFEQEAAKDKFNRRPSKVDSADSLIIEEEGEDDMFEKQQRSAFGGAADADKVEVKSPGKEKDSTPEPQEK